MSQSRIPPELEREMTPGVRAFVEALFLRIDELTAKVDRLERELGKRDQFLHEKLGGQAPPPPPPRRTPSKKRGGQPGHKRAERELVPVEKCQDAVPCRPLACRGCGEKLSGQDAQPLRHQVTVHAL